MQINPDNDEIPHPSDRDITIGEHAFRAGWDAAVARYEVCGALDLNLALHPQGWVDQAWDAYTPPDHLTGGGAASEDL